MEKNSLEYLNSMRWYRLLKVVFVFLFLLTQFLVAALISDGTDFTKKVVPRVLVLSEERRGQLDGIVMKMTEQNATDETVQLIVNDFKSKYALQATELDILKIVWVYSAGFILVLLAFILIRQSFLYVFTGNFRKL